MNLFWWRKPKEVPNQGISPEIQERSEELRDAKKQRIEADYGSADYLHAVKNLLRLHTSHAPTMSVETYRDKRDKSLSVIGSGHNKDLGVWLRNLKQSSDTWQDLQADVRRFGLEPSLKTKWPERMAADARARAAAAIAKVEEEGGDSGGRSTGSRPGSTPQPEVKEDDIWKP